jgi:hydroxyacylglutathione hydrolase
MLFKRFESEGLAHYSYLIGDGGRAVVIDPRRDCDVYVQAATQEGTRVTHVLETHRNEDYVIGSVELASRTGAVILHSAHDDLAYGYGEPIRDGDTLKIGRLRLEALHTPGHTLGHMSYLLYEPGGAPWIVFTGDTLFAGDVGRTDFYGRDRLEEITGLLYESLFHKILPLGDEVIVCPAHGAGSVCGTAIADRTWTTIGLERKHNPKLQYTDKADFVQHVGRMLEYPPYFRMMEKLNLEGPPILGRLPSPTPLSPEVFAKRAEDAHVLDTRMELGFGSAHVSGALSIWEEGVSSFAGWFLSYDKPVLLVTETNDVSRAVRYLIRLGFDRLDGFLAGGMLAWHKAGLDSRRIEAATVQDLCHLLDTDEDVWVLDIRSDEEVERKEIPVAHHIHITQLLERLGEVPRDRPVYIFCGSGLRSMIAASLLRRDGRENLTVVLGGLMGWSSTTCPLE